MSALPNQAYANLDNPYWLKAGAPTPSGQSVPELSVIGAGSIIEERLLTTPSNAQIQINTLVGNTRSFKMGLFFTPDLVNPVPANNSMRIDVGNALPAITLTQSNITFTQPLILDTLANTCNFTISQSSTSTTLSNGASVIAMNNNGVIGMLNSTSIVTGGQSNLTSASNVRFKNASGDTEVLSSGGSLQLNGVNVGSGCNDTYLTVDPNGFQGVQFNTAKRTGWLPEAGKVVNMRGIIDPANANFGAFVIDLDNTISNLFKTPFGVGADYVFAQDQFRVLTSGNSNVCNVLTANATVMCNVGLNRYANSFLDPATGNYVFAVGTISPSTFIPSIVISNNGVVGFPVGIDVTSFSNSPTTSNSIGGVTLSSGGITASPAAISYLGQFSIFSNQLSGQGGIDIKLNSNVTINTLGNITNPFTTCNYIGGVVLSNDKIVGNGTASAASKGFYINQAIANTIVYYIIQYNISGFRGVTVPLFGSLTFQNITGYAWAADNIIGFMLPPYTMIEGYYTSPGTSNYSYSNATAFATYPGGAQVNLSDSNWYFRVLPIDYF
jgi:hypothetical protein